MTSACKWVKGAGLAHANHNSTLIVSIHTPQQTDHSHDKISATRLHYALTSLREVCSKSKIWLKAQHFAYVTIDGFRWGFVPCLFCFSQLIAQKLIQFEFSEFYWYQMFNCCFVGVTKCIWCFTENFVFSERKMI